MQDHGRAQDIIVYGVIPRIFGKDGLRSVTERLPYLGELGINAIWLSPINAGPAGHFGYHVTDYFALKPSIGTEADLAELVAVAHEHGIRVLMDFVPNHTSLEHPWFQDAEKRGRDSPYYTYYDRDDHGQPTHYFHWSYLPNLNFDNPDVRRTIVDAFGYWIREFDIDGYRVDVAWGIKQRAPDFWPMCRQELSNIKSDVLLIAEASARDDYYVRNGFDAAYDWTDELGHWAWENVFTERTGIASRLRSALTSNGERSAADSSVFRFLNNNDTATRFIDTHGPELTRTAAALLLTLPGIPCIYTGDEIGASYLPYDNPDDPAPLDWDSDPHGLRPWYRRLIMLRHQHPSLHSGVWELVDTEPNDRVLAYVRYGSDVESPSLVLLNFSDAEVEASVGIPDRFGNGSGEQILVDVLDDERRSVKIGASAPVLLPAWGASIFQSPSVKQAQ